MFEKKRVVLLLMPIWLTIFIHNSQKINNPSSYKNLIMVIISPILVSETKIGSIKRLIDVLSRKEEEKKTLKLLINVEIKK